MALTVPFADAAFDLAQRWRPLTAEEEGRANVLLEDASQLILDEDSRDIYADAVDPPSQTLVRVVCSMVKRAMLTPAGDVSQLQQAAGPFSTSTVYSNPAGALYLTSAERRALGFTRQRAAGVDLWTPPEE